MGFRFRRSIRLLPGVRINLGARRGPSVTLGSHGASVNVGPSGSYVNAGIPGTGVSYRERIDESSGAATHDPVRAAAVTESPKPRSFTWLLVLLLGIALGALLF